MNPFLTADYRDGRVRIGSKTYAAGAYAVHLLNQYYKNDTAARLSAVSYTHLDVYKRQFLSITAALLSKYKQMRLYLKYRRTLFL